MKWYWSTQHLHWKYKYYTHNAERLNEKINCTCNRVISLNDHTFRHCSLRPVSQLAAHCFLTTKGRQLQISRRNCRFHKYHSYRITEYHFIVYNYNHTTAFTAHVASELFLPFLQSSVIHIQNDVMCLQTV